MRTYIYTENTGQWLSVLLIFLFMQILTGEGFEHSLLLGSHSLVAPEFDSPSPAKVILSYTVLRAIARQAEGFLPRINSPGSTTAALKDERFNLVAPRFVG